MDSVLNLQNNLDIVWIITAAAMVMFMQAGFTALEAGLTRSKNSINVAMKNLTDFIVSVLIFWLVGYGIMFGDSASGWWGTSLFRLDGVTDAKELAIFVFQVTFAGTAVTIVSGAVAERIRFSAYIIIAVIVIAVVYPVSGHWIWSSDGWLAQKGFVDFAGSTVVHSLGGWVGLAGALVLGARAGRFDSDGKPNKIHGQNLVMAVLGVLILWFGWFGFNGGSTLTGDKSIALVIVNTLLCSAAGGISCFFSSMLFHSGIISIEKMLNGVVGGLVAITAGCAVVEPAGAIFIGLIAGVLVFTFEEILLHVWKVDDPVNVIAAHGFAGAWGTLALAFAAPVENLPLKNAWAQFMVQFQGVFCVFLWGFIAGLILFSAMKSFGFLRVSKEAEESGLNAHEHGASTGLLETMKTMEKIVKAYNAAPDSKDVEEQGDLTVRIKTEFGAEGHEISCLFNQMMDYFHDTIYEIKHGMADVLKASAQLASTGKDMHDELADQSSNTHTVTDSMRNMGNGILHIHDSTKETVNVIEQATMQTEKGKDIVEGTIESVIELADQVQIAYRSISELQDRMDNIEGIIDTISCISEQTNLLALNAAIEAARAGEAGRGFAVVADEVRTLSNKTQGATTHIKDLIAQLQESSHKARDVISDSQKNAELTVNKARDSHQALINITESVYDISGMSLKISDVALKQTTLAKNMDDNILKCANLTNSSIERAEHVTNTSKNLRLVAHQLQDLVKGLKISQAGKMLH